jgi:hypothetical protein
MVYLMTLNSYLFVNVSSLHTSFPSAVLVVSNTSRQLVLPGTSFHYTLHLKIPASGDHN